MNENEIVINGVTYIQKSSIGHDSNAENKNPYVLIRTYSAGVFMGYLKKRDEDEVTLTNARRIWYWDGAASLSQLAMEGTSKPENCKFPCEVNEIDLLGVIEVIYCTEKAKESIKNVAVWSA